MSLITSRPKAGWLLIPAVLMAWTPFLTASDAESIATFELDCSTPKSVFILGDSVCAVATGAPLGPPTQRRFEWVAPDGTVLRLGPDILSDSQPDLVVIPKSGSFAQVGTWTVKTVDASNNGFSVARFVVHDPGSDAADLSLSMFGPFQVSAGSSTTFSLRVSNGGPDDATNVRVTVTVASNSTLNSGEQTTGPLFTCTNLPLGGAGSTTFAIEALPANAAASFIFVYQIDPETPNGASITSTATVSGSTADVHNANNAATATSTITAQPCNIACPPGITTAKRFECGVVVNYSDPAPSGNNCGALTCSPASGSFFPVGTSNVICFGNSGSPCSFPVTVNDPLHPKLNCPSDVRITESSPSMGLAVVTYKPPTLSDNCEAETAACAPPSGSSFPLGVSTVTCEQNNASGEGSTCSFSVIVETSDCTLSAPGNIDKSNKPGECGSLVSYPTPTTTGSCGVITCAPRSGGFFPIGTTIVSCNSRTGSSATFAVTVRETQLPPITNISANPSTLPPSDDKMKDVTINYETSHNCSADITCSLTVNSNEELIVKERADKTPDWKITDAHHVRLRAVRSSMASKRIYTITITCTDASGNSTSKTVTVNGSQNHR